MSDEPDLWAERGTGASMRRRPAAQADAARALPTAERARALLRRIWGYERFRGDQEDIICHVADGGDALVLMPTGGGKSVCYQLPALLREGVALVVSPLIALMQDQVETLRTMGVRAEFLNSTIGAREAARIERAAEQGELDLLYMAPERLFAERGQALLERLPVSLLAIDEAHCVSQWGHDFRPEYARLGEVRELLPDVPCVALTATADATTRDDIVATLALHGARRFVSSFDRPNIRYRIVERRDPRGQLRRFLGDHEQACGIIYCLSRRKVEETAAWLSEIGLSAAPYHAGLDAGTRADAQRRFLRDEIRIIVATIAFGMGIDKPDVRFVVHLDLPRSIEGYYQETGRAGRDGEASEAWMVYGLQDVVQQRRMIDESEASDEHRRIVTSKLDAMLGLCETTECRRGRLLAYFGEHREAGWRCGNCDTCLEPPRTYDGTEPVRMLLSAIYRTGQRFGAQHVIDVLRGAETDKIRRFGHEQLSVHGVGAAIDALQWRSILRQAIAGDLVGVDHARFGALRLTESARPVLRGERSIMLREFVAAPARSRSRSRRGADGAGAQAGEPPGAALDGAANACFERLRAWRAQLARERGVPPYVIFHDRTLQAVALRRPTRLHELEGIAGIGEKKRADFGDALVALCAEPDHDPGQNTPFPDDPDPT
ncbi:MAG: DNA helicase RecQ [Burkholderiaceae bacterium]